MTLAGTAPSRSLSRGDIVLVMFPFSALISGKRRPAVLVAEDPSSGDFTLAFITSRQAVPVTAGEVALLPTHPEFSLS